METIEEFYIEKAIGKPLTIDQKNLIHSHLSAEIISTLLTTLQTAKIQFCIAGSFPEFAVGQLDSFNDIDFFINVGSIRDLPHFDNKLKHFEVGFEGADFWSYNQNSEKDTYEKYLSDKKYFQLEVTEVLKYKYKPEKANFTLKYDCDFVFAENPKCTTSNSYALFILRQFDIQVARVALFNPFPLKNPSLVHFHTLTTPTFKELRDTRKYKYVLRKISISPSLLSTLSLVTLMDNGYIDQDYESGCNYLK